MKDEPKKKRISNTKTALIWLDITLLLILAMLIVNLMTYNENGHGGTIFSIIVAGFFFVVISLALIRE